MGKLQHFTLSKIDFTIYSSIMHLFYKKRVTLKFSGGQALLHVSKNP